MLGVVGFWAQDAVQEPGKAAGMVSSKTSDLPSKIFSGG